MSIEEQRKQIHDLANSLSVIEGLILITSRSLKKDRPELTSEIERLDKALDHSKKSIETLHKLRALVKSQAE